MTAEERGQKLADFHDLGESFAYDAAKAIEAAEREAVAESSRRCAAIIREVVAPPYGDAMAEAFINGDLIFGRIDVIKEARKAAILESREACAKIVDNEHANPGDDIDAVLTRVAEVIRKRGQP